MPGGSTIQIPAMGVQVAQTFFEKLPAAANFNTLAKIVQDKELLTLALKTPRSPEEKEGLLKAFFRRAKKVFGEGWEEASGFASPRIAFALSRPVQIGPRIQAPYAGQAPQEEPVEEEPAPEAPGPDQRAMAPVPPAPTRVAAGPAPALGPRIPAAPPVPPTQSSGPVDRGRFLSLFPSGVAADVARSQQGIGSLM